MRLPKLVKLGIIVAVMAVIALVAVACSGSEADAETKITTSHGELTLQQIAEIQPGLGTVMQEYGKRFAMIKVAAEAEDWGMAQYQLTEALEIQEVGEITRPANAGMLKSFENSYLGTLDSAIKAKDKSAFDAFLKLAPSDPTQ
jgi:ABC-type glycerol-3-phosphate transport system substrate-binding protein